MSNNEHKNQTQTELSTITLFEDIRTAIEKIDTYPLTRDTLEINQDSYAELGDDIPGEGIIFARIGMDFPKKDSDLPFMMLFGSHGAALAFGAQEFVFCHYELLGDTEQHIARNLVAILVALANGQITLLNSMTQDNEKVQAWELLYRAPDRQLYDALATNIMFDSARKLKNREMVTEKFANSAAIRARKVDVGTLKLFIADTDARTKIDRTQIPGLHIPLTRDNWEKSVNKYYEDMADAVVEKVDRWVKKDDRSMWQQIVDAAKWRHLELLWWWLALMLYAPISQWSLEALDPIVTVFGALVILATIFRNTSIVILGIHWLKPLLYIGFILSLFLHFLEPASSIWWWVIGIFSVMSLIENFFFDIRTFVIARSNPKP